MSAPVIHHLQNRCLRRFHDAGAQDAKSARRLNEMGIATRSSSDICVFAVSFVKRSQGNTTLAQKRKDTFVASGSNSRSRFCLLALW